MIDTDYGHLKLRILELQTRWQVTHKVTTTEDEMAGWHHPLNGHEFESTPGVGNAQGGLVCCSSWGCRIGHDLSNWSELNWWHINERDRHLICDYNMNQLRRLRSNIRDGTLSEMISQRTDQGNCLLENRTKECVACHMQRLVQHELPVVRRDLGPVCIGKALVVTLVFVPPEQKEQEGPESR